MIEKLARFGYVCIGVVYVIVGYLAGSAAVGHGGSTAGQKGAFAFILHQPFGRFLLAVLAAGLLGYAVWRIISAAVDSEQRGDDAKGLALRAAAVGRGLIYGWIAYEVVRLIMHRSSGSGGDAEAKHWTARALDAPFGKWLVVLAGLTVAGYGAYQFFKGVSGKLSKRLRFRELDAAVRRNAIAISRFGISARGVIFVIIGASLLRAAFHRDPHEAHGTSGALRELAQHAHGWPLMLVAIGLASYGVYAFVNARCRAM